MKGHSKGDDGIDWVKCRFRIDGKQDNIDWKDLKKNSFALWDDEMYTLEDEDVKEEGPDPAKHGHLGERLAVTWGDGGTYKGVVEKCMKNNDNVVFIRYDDGDQVWCNLLKEKKWKTIGTASGKKSAKRKASDIPIKKKKKKN